MNPPRLEMYCIETFTGHKAQSHAKIYVTLHGTNHSQRIPLSQSSQETPNTFRKGAVDSFYAVIPEVTDLSGITVFCTDNRGKWYVEQVIVKVGGKSYKAVFNTSVSTELYQPLTLIADHTTPYMQGKIILGPILKFRGNFSDIWCVSAMVVTENVPGMPGSLLFYVRELTGIAYSSPPVCFYQQNNYQMWRFDFQIPVNDFEQVCTYRLPMLERDFSFNIPARNQKPGILFCSCNDRAHPFNLTPNENVHKSVGWEYMCQQLAKSKYHLLILGGDQIYADSLFVACESVRGWDGLPKGEKYTNSAKYFSAKTIEELNCFYFNMYIFCWSYQATSTVTAAVPTAMMFDDHDIYDGWGSLDPHINDSDMMINIFKVAKKFFFLFQMQGDLSSVMNERLVPDDPHIVRMVKDTPPFESFGYPQQLNDQGPFNTALSVSGGVSVVLLDLRTERRMFTHSQGIIMRENSYVNFEKFLTRRAQRPEPQHLFIVLTVPIHYPDAALFNKALDLTHNELIDDVRDHYSAAIHRAERGRVLNDLAIFCTTAAAGSRATILAGDVHLAAFSSAAVWLRDQGVVTIEQYISSGIAAKPPPLFAQRMMGTPLFRSKDKMETTQSHIVQEMRRLPTGKYFFRHENFLCLNPIQDTYNAMWVGNPVLRKAQARNHEKANPLPPPTSFSRNIE